MQPQSEPPSNMHLAFVSIRLAAASRDAEFGMVGNDDGTPPGCVSQPLTIKEPPLNLLESVLDKCMTPLIA